ncbi:MAG: hypothetical protein ACQERD_04525 [Campylobacterota bacterium]
MEPNIEKIIVLTIVLTASVITWKLVKDFYITKLNKAITYLLAVITACFMLLSSMFLFMPKDYQRGSSSEVELSLMSVVTVIVMVAVLYIFFKYVPQNKE